MIGGCGGIPAMEGQIGGVMGSPCDGGLKLEGLWGSL